MQLMPLGMQFSMKEAKQFFFDRAAVIKALDAGTRKTLSRQGAFVRQRMKSITHYRSKNPAKSGSPPHAHAGQLTEKIAFAFDPSTINDPVAVVGPTKFKKGEAPELLEFGGSVMRMYRGKMVRYDYHGNPFARPALEAEVKAGTIRGEWRGAVVRV